MELPGDDEREERFLCGVHLGSVAGIMEVRGARFPLLPARSWACAGSREFFSRNPRLENAAPNRGSRVPDLAAWTRTASASTGARDSRAPGLDSDGCGAIPVCF